MTTMASLTQSSRSIPPRATLLDEIRALRVEVDVANKKIQRYNDTIVSQANELTILRNTICQSCKRKFLDATLDLSPSVAPHGGRPLHGVAGHSSSSTPQASASSSSVQQAPLPAVPAFPSLNSRDPYFPVVFPTQPTPSLSLSRLLQAGASLSPKTAAASRHVPPPRQFGTTETTRTLSSSDASAPPANTNLEFPWSVSQDPKVDKMLDVTFQCAFAHKLYQVECVEFSLDGKYLAIGILKLHWLKRYFDGKVIVYSTENGKQACLLAEYPEEERSGLRTLCFSPNGKQVAVGYSDTHIRLWIILTKRVRNIFRGHRAPLSSLDFSPDGQSIVSVSGDNTARIWSVRDGSSRILDCDSVVDWGQCWCVRFSPDGKYITAVNDVGFLRIWDSRTRQLVMEWRGHRHVVTGLAFMLDAKGVVNGRSDGLLEYWDVATLGDDQSMKIATTLQKSLAITRIAVSSIAITPDGRWLLSGSQDRIARLWNIPNGTQQCTFHGHPGWVRSVDVSSVGNYLAIGDQEGQVSLWRYKVMRG